MRLPKFLQRKSRNWGQRVNFWPTEYPHRITDYTDVAALQHTMALGGIMNTVAIDRLLRDEQFWWDLTDFFKEKVGQLGEIEFVPTVGRASIRKLELYCWEDAED